jgi:hypothetical protein
MRTGFRKAPACARPTGRDRGATACDISRAPYRATRIKDNINDRSSDRGFRRFMEATVRVSVTSHRMHTKKNKEGNEGNDRR